MDHLPSPQNQYNSIQVPDLGGGDYDAREFHGYDKRCGWDVKRLVAGDVHGAYSAREHEPEGPRQHILSTENLTAKAAQFFQTWLFFGALTEVLGCPIDRSGYSVVLRFEDGSEGSYISTKRLLPDIQKWTSRVKESSHEEQTQSWERTRKCLNDAALILESIKENEPSTTSTASCVLLSDEISLSIAILLFTLNFYAYMAYPEDIYGSGAVVSVFGRSSILRPRMVKAGWCPALLARLNNRFGPPGLYYAYLLGPPLAIKSHSACTPEKCLANFVDEESYRTLHVTETCSCEHLDAPQQRLVDILRAGQIPLVSLADGNDGFSLAVVPYEQDMRYVALSHVWSDGLGNPYQNSLPICQLRSLRERVGNLGGTAATEGSASCLIWMDSLCVPLAPESSRYTAIMAMQKTYEMADAVLVLDAQLTRIVASDTSHEEILMRVFCSSWMTRLWTMQEAAFASRLYFQFADKPIEYSSLSRAVKREREHAPAFFIANRADASLRAIFGTPRFPSQVERFSALWSALRWRSTTKERDVPVCVATLLGSNVRKVLETVDEEKMQAFWSGIEEIPSSILWVGGPRLKTSNFRWAPSSLLDPRTLRAPLSHRCISAYWSTSGLFVQGLPGYRLSNTWIPKLEDGCFCFKAADSGQIYKVFKSGDDVNGTWVDIGLHWIQKPALLLEKEVTGGNLSSGVLVGEYATIGGTIRTTWLALVSVFEEGGYYDRLMGAKSFGTQKLYTKDKHAAAFNIETGELAEARGERIGAEQTWYIS
ncbi:MAG: hypothetical protein M1840_004787 [Geoglossum simile]|nr:MAG: hypothetical protein M1840_004787 [Geoglossum simile]